jgi:hypothetical protein
VAGSTAADDVLEFACLTAVRARAVSVVADRPAVAVAVVAA